MVHPNDKHQDHHIMWIFEIFVFGSLVADAGPNKNIMVGDGDESIIRHSQPIFERWGVTQNIVVCKFGYSH